MINLHVTWLQKIQPVKSFGRKAKLFLLLASTYFVTACSLTEFSGAKQEAFERNLQQSYFDLAPVLGAYYAFATTEFQVLDDPRLTQALQHNGALVCTNPPCSVEAVELQSFYCLNDDPDFILLEISSPKLTLQRLYQRSMPHRSYALAGPVSVYSMYDDLQMLPNSQLQRYRPQPRIAYQQSQRPQLQAAPATSPWDNSYVQSILATQSEMQAHPAKSQIATQHISESTDPVLAPAAVAPASLSPLALASNTKARNDNQQTPSSLAPCIQGKNCHSNLAAKHKSSQREDTQHVETAQHGVVLEVLEFKQQKAQSPDTQALSTATPPTTATTAARRSDITGTAASPAAAQKDQKAKKSLNAQKIKAETVAFQDAESIGAANPHQDSSDLLNDLHQRINSYRQESLLQQNLRAQQTVAVPPPSETRPVENKANNQFPRIFERMSQSQNSTVQQIQTPLLLRLPAPS